MDKQLTSEEYYIAECAKLRSLKPEELLDLQKKLIPEIDHIVNIMCLLTLQNVLEGKGAKELESYLVSSIAMFKLCQRKFQNLTPSEN